MIKIEKLNYRCMQANIAVSSLVLLPLGLKNQMFIFITFIPSIS